jgi:CDP-diacylglycerol---serine O-phosphatidyltransferase
MARRRPRPDEGETDSLPFYTLLPNLVTMLGLCAGLTAIRFVFSGNYQIAVMLVLFSVAIDGLDGLLARRLQATSEIGAQLDSLSDFLNFGVVPGLLVYEFVLADSERAGAWVAVLLYSSCCCLRLARFNVAHIHAQTAGTASPKHFTGVPAPAGALMALLPVYLNFEFGTELARAPMLVALWLAVVGILMASRLPTFSPKSLRVPRSAIVWVMIALPFIVGTMLTRFWLSLILIDGLYALSLLQSALRVLLSRRTSETKEPPSS